MNTSISAESDIDIERQRVMEQVLDATTLLEITAAKQILRDWLTLHLEEQGMRAGFEQLYLLEEIALEQTAREQEAERQEAERQEAEQQEAERAGAASQAQIQAA